MRVLGFKWAMHRDHSRRTAARGGAVRFDIQMPIPTKVTCLVTKGGGQREREV